MFNALTTKLSGIFSRLGSRGILKEKDIEDGLREIRIALLEADVYQSQRVASGCQGIYGSRQRKGLGRNSYQSCPPGSAACENRL